MAINLQLADAYFDPAQHVFSHAWTGFTPEQRQAAINHTIRDFERIFKDDYDDSTTTSDDFPRMDLAVYEQALELLMRSGVANGEMTAPRYTGEDPQMKRDYEFCPAAKAWLYNLGGKQIEIERGS